MRIKDRLLLRARFQLWARLRVNNFPSFNMSHSQFGEDMVIRYLTDNASAGFYVDAGAHHPICFSNTYYFYCKGWSGINIDALPGSMEAFRILRPRDINVEACLYPVDNAEVEYFLFDDPAYNTLDRQMVQMALAAGSRLIETRVVRSRTLAGCLDEYLPKGREIDLMTVDLEGLDEAILTAHDWSRYAPRILAFERHLPSFRDLESLPLIGHLGRLGYEVAARCGPTVIMKRQEKV
jgi:Methyltransferase FkbM domain